MVTPGRVHDVAVTTARRVPVTTDMSGDELDAEDAWNTVRKHGPLLVLRESFLRFRFGDGFSSSRALALQMALGLVPFLVALTGLASDLDSGEAASVVARTVAEVSPGTQADQAMAELVDGDVDEDVGEVALVVGLLVALFAMVTATAQIERGTNRIYGIRRDRPALLKYGRAAVLTLVLMVPVGTGFVLLVGGGALGDALADVYGWTSGQHLAWDVARWPVGLLTTTFTIAVLLDHVPRRRQPALSWLALGSGVAVAMTMASTALLALYVRLSTSFDAVYGPLAGIFALLLWCYLSAISLFAGTAVAAQTEALHARAGTPVHDDPESTPEGDVTARAV